MNCPTTGKLSYRNRKAALRALCRVLENRILSGWSLGEKVERVVYACPHCRRWHLSSREVAPEEAETCTILGLSRSS